MPDYLIYGVIAIIVLIILWFIITKVLKNKTTSLNTAKSIPVEVDGIVRALGGNNNIEEVNATNSKITFKLLDDKLVDVDSLKELGASGVVISGSKVSVILGTKSKDIAEAINKK